MNALKSAVTPKRHNSVSFSSDSSNFPTECKSWKTKWRTFSTNLHPNCNRHGSIMNLMMRHKVKKESAGRGTALIGGPSVPSLPMAILQAMISPRLKKGRSKAFSLTSLDGEEQSAAFSSVCSSSASTTGAQSNAFGRTSESQTAETMAKGASRDSCVCPSPWKCTQSEGMENFDGQANGHLFILHTKGGAVSKERIENGRPNGDGAILCAEGNTQTHLLRLVAPCGKRVVNVGRSTGDEAIRSGDCHRLFSHNPNNLNPYE